MSRLGRGLQRGWLVGVLCCLLGLSGCQLLLPSTEPPPTWIPLPTAGPAATPTPWPSATPVHTPTPMTPSATPTAAATATPVEPTATPDGAASAAWARDRAWAAFVTLHAADDLPATPEWTASEAEPAPEATTYRYEQGGWHLSVLLPATPDPDGLLDVNVAGPQALVWDCQVLASGEVQVVAPPVTPTPELVADWRGTIQALPSGAQYDDFYRLVGGTGGQYGLDAADPALQARIQTLRDSGQVVRLWGRLVRDVPDYGGSQIRVERLDVLAPPPTRAPESELVEGWLGVVRALPAGSAFDDLWDGVEPAGQQGIEALLPELQAELEAARVAGSLLRVWGVLDYGVADYGGARIVVTRLEIVQ